MRLLSTIILTSIIMSGCATTDTPPFDLNSAKPPKESVIARVNREPITLSEFLAAYESSGGRYSEAEFLDEYIKLRIGVQKARRLHLDSHPSVFYAADLAIFTKYLEERHKVLAPVEPISTWKKAYLENLRKTGTVWTDLQIEYGGISNLGNDHLIARVNGEAITVSEFKTIFWDKIRKKNDAKLLSDYIDIKLVVDEAQRVGWLEEKKSFINVAHEQALYNLVNNIEFGTNKINPKRIKKMYRKERERSDVETYSSSLFF